MNEAEANKIFYDKYGMTYQQLEEVYEFELKGKIKLMEEKENLIKWLQENINQDDNGCGEWWVAFPSYMSKEEIINKIKEGIKC